MNIKNLITGLYVTSNQEAPEFEQRIKDNILKNCGDITIISVSQKPINFGKNICVGDDIGVSGYNMFRQVKIGLEEVKTKFVLSLEADTLYPPSYFKFIPSRDDKCYRNSNLYVMAHKRPIFWKKVEGATHSQHIACDFYLSRLEKLFKGLPKWNSSEKNFPKERYRKEDVFNLNEIEHYKTKDPVVQIKTSSSMRHYTVSDRKDRYNIPYWGDSIAFRKKYYDIGHKH